VVLFLTPSSTISLNGWIYALPSPGPKVTWFSLHCGATLADGYSARSGAIQAGRPDNGAHCRRTANAVGNQEKPDRSGGQRRSECRPISSACPVWPGPWQLAARLSELSLCVPRQQSFHTIGIKTADRLRRKQRHSQRRKSRNKPIYFPLRSTLQ
jgi:hypothetical protein